MVRVKPRTLLIFSAVIAVLLGGLGVALQASRERSRHELDERLDERTTIAAALVESTLKQSIQTQTADAAERFGGPTVTAHAMRDATDAMPGSRIVVTDAHGVVLGGYPAGTAAIGRSLIRSSPAIRAVAAGQVSALDVSRSGAPVVSLVIGFSTAYGRRISRVTFPAGLMQAFLNSYLTRVANLAGDRAFVSDSQGTIIARTGDGDLPQGKGRVGDDVVSVARIAGTDWNLGLAVTAKRLYAPISGPTRWLPWILFAAFAAAAAFALVLLRRLQRGAQQLQDTNLALAARTEEALAAAQTKSDFLATMSHELRTPLNGIIGFAELMHDGRVGPVSDTHKEYLGDILTSSEHLRRLIDDVLDLSKIEAGKIDLRPEPVDLGRLVAETCDVMASVAARKRITLRRDIDPRIGVVEADPAKLRQVLFNYLSNALKFTPEGGHVLVCVEPADHDRFVMSVEDDGPGIPAADRERLWEAFEQGDSGSSRRYGGSGLGLSLTRRLVEAVGGEVGVDSSTPGGARFWAAFPLITTVAEVKA